MDTTLLKLLTHIASEKPRGPKHQDVHVTPPAQGADASMDLRQPPLRNTVRRTTPTNVMETPLRRREHPTEAPSVPDPPWLRPWRLLAHRAPRRCRPDASARHGSLVPPPSRPEGRGSDPR